MTTFADAAAVGSESYLDDFRAHACRVAGRQDASQLVVSPYRFNPLGAHIDHQGGRVLARTLNQYTLLAFWPQDAPQVDLHFVGAAGTTRSDRCRIALPSATGATVSSGASMAGDSSTLSAGDSRVRFAAAAVAVLDGFRPLSRGLCGVVHGTLMAAGLSSSASVVLAYLRALAAVNDVELDDRLLVELVRQVENEHLGLNNGLQDPMSVVYGRDDALSCLDVETVASTPVPDPPTIDEVRWLLCYSGVSRELAAGSGFNTRVAECREAAGLLQSGAQRLGEVEPTRRTAAVLADLPSHLGRRARHVFGEMERVSAGCVAWSAGDWLAFGELMNASCRSSIDDYESGSEWLIALHRIATTLPGVRGSRFSGGGYGGCLVMLVDRDAVGSVEQGMLQQYQEIYPDKRGVARCFVAKPENGVRIA